LEDLARRDPELADAARAGFESLTWGEGLGAVTVHGLADFLWYQLPTKWMCDLDEKQLIAAGLGDLFARLGRPRYADMCDSPRTADILATYEHDGSAAGLHAYRAALSATGTRPPDIPDVIEWGSVMGGDEASAYWAVSVALEHAIDSGTLRPGRPGWKKTAVTIARTFLDSPREDLTDTTWLQWVHTERLQLWSESRSELRRRLASTVVNRLIHPATVPEAAERSLAPLRWLLEHAEAGAALTQTGNLSRAIVAEGCERFGWWTGRGGARSESQVFELLTLRDLAKQLGIVRRVGRRLMLTAAGRALLVGGRAAQWRAVVNSLLAGEPAEATAGEVAFLLLLGREYGLMELNTAVTDVLIELGWHEQRSGAFITPDQTSALLGCARRLLPVFGFVEGDPYSLVPMRFSDVGKSAVVAALRIRALRPRTFPA
jgi:hypothetical protein